MLDHGALGTLMIGLEAVRHEPEMRNGTMPQRSPRARTGVVRLALAGLLRGLADVVDAKQADRVTAATQN